MLITKRMKDLTDQKFGRLTAKIPIGYQKGTNSVVWECICECGNITNVIASALRNGNTISCGCYQKEQSKKMFLALGDMPASKAFWHDYKRSARRRNYEFTLTLDQFREITQSNCFYCGVQPNNHFADGRFLTPYICNGIDRRNNAKGYTVENSVACCSQCNYAKRNISESEFLEWINKVYNYQKNILLD